jgi:hypothetical protein
LSGHLDGAFKAANNGKVISRRANWQLNSGDACIQV